ncbi:MAG: hypothetical protein GF411_08885 [Candidatus Lokiarchaeota archaeon]|nr:hypothetical protein [Candidatus Lokiarchaeota archaeon]
MTRFLFSKGHDGPIRQGEFETSDKRIDLPALSGPGTDLPFCVLDREFCRESLSLLALPPLTTKSSVPIGSEPFFLPSIPNTSLFNAESHRSLLKYQMSVLEYSDSETCSRAVLRTNPNLPLDTFTAFISEGNSFGIRSSSFQFDGDLGQKDLHSIRLRVSTPLSWTVFALGRIEPYMLPLLIYLGFDIIDVSRAQEAAAQDIRLWKFVPETFDEHSEERFCSCPACNDVIINNLQDKQRFDVLFHHNLTLYRVILSQSIQMANNGRLRWFIESLTHANPNMVGFLRRIDSIFYSYLEEFTPTAGSGIVPLIGPESYFAPLVRRFRDFVKNRYQPPTQKKAVLLLPCSARKPYSDSRSHKRFQRAIDSALGSVKHQLSEVILTSPLGLVPRELERIFPAANYDIPVTGNWDAEELHIAADTLVDHLGKFDKSVPVVAHATGGYRSIIELAENKIRQNIIYTEISGSATRRESLTNLSKTLEKLKRDQNLEPSPSTELRDTLRATADFQFGTSAGNLLIPDKAKLKGKLYRMVLSKIDKEQTCAFVASNGSLSLTLYGGELIQPLEKYWARFEGAKVRGGALFAVGVKNADYSIRPGDEVIVLNEDNNVVAVGRSEMSGREMCELDYGEAISFRHKVK